MKDQIIKLDEKDNKVFGFSEEQLIVSTKEHGTFSSLANAIDKSGLLESITNVPMDSINEVMYNEKEKSFKVKYHKKGRNKKLEVNLEDTSLRHNIVEEIARIKGLNKSVVSESKIQPLLLNLLGVLGIPLFTWVARGMAIDAQNGGHYEATGRRSGLKQLFANAVEAIGPTGVSIIGVLCFIYMLYITYRRFANPASELRYN